MDILCISSQEGRVDDRIAREFQAYSRHNVGFNNHDAKTIWLLAPWIWKTLPLQILKSKKVVCTIHHEVPDKFDENRSKNFKKRDQYVDIYHVPCQRTKDFIQNFTSKPITIIGYWYNQDTWQNLDKAKLREKYQEHFHTQDFVIGSFQRDSEGANLNNPKLEKGPDLFFDYISNLRQNSIHILLAGWRRTYLINKLKKSEIPYTYFELADTTRLNELYSACDLYAVMSRQEGGPQALFEAPACGTPIISTDVGMAREVLPEQCIINANNVKQSIMPQPDDVKQTQDKMKKFEIQNHIKNYDNFFSSL